MTSENKKWDSLKTEYLHKIEKALSSIKHPRSKDILEDVRSHLDRRFAELEPDQQTRENFQAIITEMGPASDYAELLEPAAGQQRRSVPLKYLLGIGFAIVVIVSAGILLPKVISPKVGYIVTFKPVSPFEPQTARELLDAFNEKHPRGVRTHHYRTQVQDNRLAGYICVDTKAGRDAVVSMLEETKKLAFVKAKPAIDEDFKSLYEMGQPSLKPKPARKVSVPLNKVWNCIPLLDESTRRALAGFERYYEETYRIETGYESASESQRAAMVEQWIQEIQSTDYDKAVRAAAALNDVKADKVAAALAKAATAQKGSNRVKWIAVRGLAKTAQPETVPALIGLIDHHNKNIRTYAKVAIAEISGQFFGDSKEKWRTWWQQYLQKAEKFEKKSGPSEEP